VPLINSNVQLGIIRTLTKSAVLGLKWGWGHEANEGPNEPNMDVPRTKSGPEVRTKFLARDLQSRIGASLGSAGDRKKEGKVAFRRTKLSDK
jgi:hypothetical protein